MKLHALDITTCQMADEKKSLRNLIADGAAQYGIEQRKLWGWALSAMVSELLPNFPEGMTSKQNPIMAVCR